MPPMASAVVRSKAVILLLLLILCLLLLQLYVRVLYSKTCHQRSLKKKTKIGFQAGLLPNAGRKYCRMVQIDTFDLHLNVIRY